MGDAVRGRDRRHGGLCCGRNHRRQALRLLRTAARLRGLTAAPRPSVGHPCRFDGAVDRLQLAMRRMRSAGGRRHLPARPWPRSTPPSLYWRHRGGDGGGFLWHRVPMAHSTPDQAACGYGCTGTSLGSSGGPTTGEQRCCGGLVISAHCRRGGAKPHIAGASEHELPALKATTLETAFVPPARSARATRVRVALYHRQVAPERAGVAPWRPDARAGPNPGGGFYGPPNVNVGYINPR